MNMEAQATTKQKSTAPRQVQHITRQQLPLHCPLPEMSLWNSHPRVYLAIEEQGSAVCPYCGCEYILDED